MSLVSTPDGRFEDLPDFPYEPEYVDVGGPEMAYVDVEGDGDETFLCLHGEPSWSFLYRKMIPRLSDRGRVVAPDMIGFGRSDKYDDPEEYTYGMLYETTERFVEELDLEDVTLVCQDWGGLLGLPVAANNPERFARLVPMNTGMPDGTTTMPDVWHEFKEMTANAPELDVAKIIADGCTSDLDEDVLHAYRAPFPDEDHRAGARILPSRVPIEADMPGADVIGDARATFADWEKPVFVLFSDSDPITRSARGDLMSVFPTADEQPDTWIEGGGHFLQEDRGEAVADEIVDFVDRT
ncbi:alpha/beta fold hydrolase [Halostella sp. JP-L12]|uniref:haloalkane dehalogenase n=1 Tax=Halostella TaxID=1843185 RepID=UPI000EF85115|nr:MULTISPECIES: haloalkane dehalogenase [Halostella]NHN46862.1 alpha/beta fold hydrolase [Halostella sp. JP-L12]